MHDAWAPYDTFTRSAAGPAPAPAGAAAAAEQPGGPVHQLCTAHVQRELQAVADTAGDGQWCWAAQACDALVQLQGMVADAIAGGRDPLDADAVAQQTACLRSAARIGLSQTRARSAPLMRKHNALARRLINREAGYLRFLTDWRVPPDNNGSVIRSAVRVHAVCVSRSHLAPRRQCLTGGGSA